MRVPSFKKPTPGVLTGSKASELDRAYKIIERLSDPHPSPGLRIDVGSHGTLYALGPLPYFLARITDSIINSAQQWSHAWVAVEEKPDGTKADYPDGGSGDTILWPAYEDNNTQVANDTFVWLRQGAGQWMEFSLPPHKTITNNVSNITTVNVSDITQEACVSTPVFNTFNDTLNICVNGVWFTFCTCATHTGTGTGSGTGTGTGCIPGVCALCSNPPASWMLNVFGFVESLAVYNRDWNAESYLPCLWRDSYTLNGFSYFCNVAVLAPDLLDVSFSSTDPSIPAIPEYQVPLNLIQGKLDCCQSPIQVHLINCGVNSSGSGDGVCSSCDVTPSSWTLQGISGFSGDYVHLNGTTTSSNFDPTTCNWGFNFSDGSLGAWEGLTEFIFQNNSIGFTLVYTLAPGTTYGPDCCEPLNLQINVPASTFTTGFYPTSIFLVPNCQITSACPQDIDVLPQCCSTGTGTGTGTGGTVSTTCCPGNSIPITLHVTVSAQTGTCGTTNFTLSWDGSTCWRNTDVNHVFWSLCCIGTSWQLTSASGASSPVSVSCSPLSLVFTGVNVSSPATGCTGTATFTITA